ncbi:MAG: hypothetical protein R2771_09935 [Saprospiraceae bacterium]
MGTDELGLNEMLYIADLDSPNMVKAELEDGVHSFYLGNNGDKLIDIYSNPQTPKTTRILDLDAKLISNILVSDNPVANLKIGEVEIVHMLADDGMTILNGRLIKPYDFNLDKKYKVLVYVYGGPHLQLIRNSWMSAAPL